MAKKILCLIVFMLALVCVLPSCSNNDAPNTPDNPPHTHNFGEWETTKAETCTTEGIKERYCSCGEKQTATIAMTEHKYGEWTTTKEPTYSASGEKTRYCECGDSQTEYIPQLTQSELTLQEWITAFNTNRYQSFTMTIEYKKEMSKNFGNNIDEEYEIIACSPYLSIYSESKLLDDTYTTTKYSSNGLDPIKDAIPWRLDNLLTVLYECEDIGFSKFTYDSNTAKYNSRIIDGFNNVVISFNNGYVESIEFELEYYDVDYGDTIELGSIKINKINTTSKPVYEFDEVNSLYNSAIPSIQASTEARQGSQSSQIYDIDEIKSTFGDFLQTFVFEKNSLTEYQTECYRWYDYDEGKYIENSYHSMTLSMGDTVYLNFGETEIKYNAFVLDFLDEKLNSICFYNDSNLVFSVYLFYED